MDDSERLAYLQLSLRDGYAQGCSLERVYSPQEAARAEGDSEGVFRGAPCIWCGGLHIKWAASEEELRRYSRVDLTLIWAVRDAARAALLEEARRDVPAKEVDGDRLYLLWRLMASAGEVNRCFVPRSSMP